MNSDVYLPIPNCLAAPNVSSLDPLPPKLCLVRPPKSRFCESMRCESETVTHEKELKATKQLTVPTRKHIPMSRLTHKGYRFCHTKFGVIEISKRFRTTDVDERFHRCIESHQLEDVKSELDST